MIDSFVLEIDSSFSSSNVESFSEGQNYVARNKGMRLSVDYRKKFDGQEVCSVNEGTWVLFDGLLFNKQEVEDVHRPDRLAGLVAEELGDRLNEYRGNFRGFSFEENSGRISLFTDHLGNRPLYYFVDHSLLCCSNSVFAIARVLKERGKLKPSMTGSYSMLTYGYMVDDGTLFEGVKRLRPGVVLTFERNVSSENSKIRFFGSYEYHSFLNAPISVTEREAIENIDELFLQAVRRQSDMNRSYGLANFCALSAGLDSRMTAFALERLGVNDALYFTYSQSFEKDCTVPMRITHDRCWSWVYRNLDGGRDLLNIEQAIAACEGVVYYPWMSQLGCFLDTVNTDDMGVVHTGVIGDVVVGTYCHNEYENRERYVIGDGAFSKRYLDRLECSLDLLGSMDFEEGMMRARAINGAALGYSLCFSRVGEAASPFMDIDFFDYCMSIPVELRKHHNLYYKWTERCYPEAAKYPHNGIRITSKGPRIPYKGSRVPLFRVPSLARNVLEAKLSQTSMNPFEYWYKTQRQIGEMLDAYYYRHNSVLDFDSALKNDCDSLYKVGSVTEKTMCVTLVGSLAFVIQ